MFCPYLDFYAAEEVLIKDARGSVFLLQGGAGQAEEKKLGLGRGGEESKILGVGRVNSLTRGIFQVGRGGAGQCWKFGSGAAIFHGAGPGCASLGLIKQV